MANLDSLQCRIQEALVNGKIEYRVYKKGVVLSCFDSHEKASQFAEEIDKGGIPFGKSPLLLFKDYLDMVGDNGAKPKRDIPFWVILIKLQELLHYEEEIMNQMYDKGWADGFHERTKNPDKVFQDWQTEILNRETPNFMQRPEDLEGTPI